MNRVAIRKLSVCSLLLACLFAQTALGGDVDDTVFLKKGGRVRGLVIEEAPGQGVRLRLPDGTVKKIEAAAVDHVEYGRGVTQSAPSAAPAPAPAPIVTLEAPAIHALETGSIHVETADPATVTVDGGDYGPTPVEVGSLSIGNHKVIVTFTGAPTEYRSVTVRAGATTPVIVRAPYLDAFAARKGVAFGMGLEGALQAVGAFGFGGRVYGRVDFAASPLVDIRGDVAFGVLSAAGFGSLSLIARGDLQLNLSSVFAMSVGVDVGGGSFFTGFESWTYRNGSWSYPTTSSSGLIIGLHLSPATFRFGDSRQFMLALVEGLGLEFGNSVTMSFFEQTLSFSYLFVKPTGN